MKALRKPGPCRNNGLHEEEDKTPQNKPNRQGAIASTIRPQSRANGQLACSDGRVIAARPRTDRMAGRTRGGEPTARPYPCAWGGHCESAASGGRMSRRRL